MVRHDMAKARMDARSNRLRLELGIWTEAEKQEFREHLAELERKRALKAAKGVPLFDDQETR